MGYNESKGHMYKFVQRTINFIKGECPHGCTYCFMKRWGKQKPVRFDEKELKTDLESGYFYFVGSSCDMWADDIPDEWIKTTIDHCANFDNRYLFQSKNPYRFQEFATDLSMINAVLCTTIETNRWYQDIMNNSPQSFDRANNMFWLSEKFKTYVTIEPIMDFDLYPLVYLIRKCRPEQVNVGANTSYKVKLPEPSRDKVLQLIEILETFTVVDQKANLKRILEAKR